MGFSSFYLSGSDKTLSFHVILEGHLLASKLEGLLEIICITPHFTDQEAEALTGLLMPCPSRESCPGCFQPSNSRGEALLYRVERLLLQYLSLGFWSSIPISDLLPVSAFAWQILLISAYSLQGNLSVVPSPPSISLDRTTDIQERIQGSIWVQIQFWMFVILLNHPFLVQQLPLF